MEKKQRTIDRMKERREVPAAVRERMKEFRRIKKMILEALKPEPLTIPQIAEKTGLESDLVTYHLMTLRKFGEVETDRADDMDEYYYYRIKE
jgi:predicted ArsR family transcriptional regulator